MADTVHVSFRFRGGERDFDAPIQLQERQVQVKDNPHPYNFDYVISPSVSQEDVFDMTAKHVVQAFMDGYNGTIFAYGQSGSGKTFTMMGPESVTEALLKGMEAITPEIQNIYGIIPRAIVEIFKQINEGIQQECITYTLLANYIEIYNEKVNDIMSSPIKKNLKIREFPNVGPTVMGLTQRAISSPEEIFDCISLGTANKQVASTNQNSRSSRSHTLFILDLQQKYLTGSVKNSRINLVDLAGSERISKTGAEGQTLEEAKKINLSLTTLSRCIKALTDPKEKFVPYRESKLTLILKESLGGNSKTSLICTASMQKVHLDETINTLRFAERAKMIVCKAKSNVQRSAAELEKIISQLKEEIEKLKLKLKEGGQMVSEEDSQYKMKYMELQSQYDLFKQNVHMEIEQLRVKVASVDPQQNQDTLDLEEENELLIEQIDEYEQKIKELEKEFQKMEEKDGIINELRDQNEFNKMICEQVTKDCEDLEKQIDETRQLNQKYQSENSKLQINLDTLQKQQADFEKRIQIKDREVQQLEQQEKAYKDQIEQISNERSQIQDNLQQKEEECQQKNFQLNQSKQQIANLQEQNNLLKQQLDQQKQIFEESQKESENQKNIIQQLNNQISSLQAKYNQEKQKSDDLQKELSNVNEELEKKERSLCEKLEIQEVLQEKQQQIEKLKISQDEKNQKHNQQIDDLNQLLSQEKDKHIEEIKQIKQELSDQIKVLSEQLKTSQDALEAKIEEIKSITCEKDEYQQQVQNMKQKIEDMKQDFKNQMQKEHSSQKEKEIQFQKEKEILKQEIDQLSIRHTQNLEQTNEISQKASKKIVELQMELATLKEETSKQQQALNQQKQAKQNLVEKKQEKIDISSLQSQLKQNEAKSQNQATNDMEIIRKVISQIQHARQLKKSEGDQEKKEQILKQQQAIASRIQKRTARTQPTNFLQPEFRNSMNSTVNASGSSGCIVF